MGGASTLIGVLPTYNGSSGDWYQGGAGILAPILLILLRLLQGLGAGAEMAGASILMTEYAPRKERGFYASLPFMGVQVGTVVAALVYFLLFNANQTVKITEMWLWRVPFLASVVILVVAIFIRLKLRSRCAHWSSPPAGPSCAVLASVSQRTAHPPSIRPSPSHMSQAPLSASPAPSVHCPSCSPPASDQ
ncbi:MFS family permease [Arthrobacter sp. V4I6]|uniref:MFS transporter n=1 Tax=unclassified Arthrobacter TaxID=235627 RepID=UPI00277DF8F3|nr:MULTISPECIES: MFS transporter [unclassified Arthrobacter]MDQ0823338.1 MFS family permease [Arthrobacter sp. V1I7]MDQ0852972.1 MFS family permease [Arthrobacter sp. V4I6]